MKASELMVELGKLVNKHGDLEVYDFGIGNETLDNVFISIEEVYYGKEDNIFIICDGPDTIYPSWSQ